MTPLDPVLHDHEKRLRALDAAHRKLEDSMIVMAEIERRQTARIDVLDEWMAEQAQFLVEHERQREDWQARHDLAMKEFDEKLNGLIGWLDDFVRRNPKNGK
jgi:hypothetical protein